MRELLMRKLWIFLFTPIALAACGRNGETPAAAAPQARAATAASAERVAAETARLDEWFEARFEEALDFSPMRKTVLGRKDDYDKIDDMSESGQDVQFEWARQTLEDLRRGFDYDLLTPEAKTSYDLWVYRVERAEASRPYRRRSYVFTQMQGPQASLAQFLISFHRVDDAADMEAYIARIAGISRAVGQLLERAQIEAGEGVRPPQFAYDGVIREARALETGAPFGGDKDSPLWADAKKKIDALAANGKIDAARAAELRAAAEAALERSFKPSYDALIAWFEADKPNADAIATGVWKLPDGRAFYKEQLADITTTDMTPDEIHALGLSEVARIQGEMEAIKQKVEFEGTLQQFFAFVRDDPQFYFPNTDEGREAYLQAARDHLAFIRQRLPDYFGLLPKAQLVVKRVEPFREQPGAAQHYMQGAPDGSRPGVFYAHLSDMRAMPKPQLEDVAYHEGIPGHHLQISIAQELEGVPKFRTQASFTAFTEGWGLYAESLAKEMGAYEDPYSDFGRLSSELWRAIRLVVDTGLHSEGWTEQQAVDYFLANSPQPEGQVRSEVERYIVTPGQATAYKIGMLKIMELRDKARTELGERFDIRGFHDTLLGGGALPLSILERRVDEWIAAQKSPQPPE